MFDNRLAILAQAVVGHFLFIQGLHQYFVLVWTTSLHQSSFAAVSPCPARLPLAMEPSPDTLASFTTIGEVARWVPLKAQLLSLLQAALGLEADDPPRILAGIPESVYFETVDKFQEGEPAAPLLPGTLTRFRSLYDTCELAAGVVPTKAQREEEAKKLEAEFKLKVDADAAAAAKQALDMSATLASAMESATKVAVEAAAKAFEKALDIANQTRDSVGHVKYSATIDQTSDVTVPPISRDRAAELYQVFFKLLGGPPDEDEECSIDQLTALEHLILSGYPPYVDFALWIANYDRKKKEFTFAGMVTTPSGALRRGEFLGPPDNP